MGDQIFKYRGGKKKKNNYLKVVKLASLHSWPTEELSASVTSIPSWFIQATRLGGMGEFRNGHVIRHRIILETRKGQVVSVNTS